MKNSPLISVIIPAYNAEAFIEQAINSVLNQTYNNVEMIIVDDGSTDNTSNLILNKYTNNKIKLFKQINSGVSIARNTGIKNASGEYCLFLDADDWIEEDCVELLLSSCKQNNGIFTICDAFSVKFENNSIYKKDLRISFSDEIIETSEAIINFSKYNLKTACYKLFNLGIIKTNNILFPPNLTHGEDGLFVFRYLQHIDQLLYLSKPLWNILDNPKSVTHKAFDSSMLSGIIAYEKILDENKKYKSKKVELYLNKLLIEKIKTYASLSLFSDYTKDSDIFL